VQLTSSRCRVGPLLSTERRAFSSHGSASAGGYDRRMPFDKFDGVLIAAILAAVAILVIVVGVYIGWW